jgi:hypothetical protein
MNRKIILASICIILLIVLICIIAELTVIDLAALSVIFAISATIGGTACMAMERPYVDPTEAPTTRKHWAREYLESRKNENKI